MSNVSNVSGDGTGKTVGRREFGRLLAAAVAGIVAGGALVGCTKKADPEPAKTTDDKGKSGSGCSGPGGCGANANIKDKHACKGLNACKGNGGCGGTAGKNECAGKGGCATVKHECKGKNECARQGGCKTDKNECKGKNACKGQGGCKVAM